MIRSGAKGRRIVVVEHADRKKLSSGLKKANRTEKISELILPPKLKKSSPNTVSTPRAFIQRGL